MQPNVLERQGQPNRPALARTKKAPTASEAMAEVAAVVAMVVVAMVVVAAAVQSLLPAIRRLNRSAHPRVTRHGNEPYSSTNKTGQHP